MKYVDKYLPWLILAAVVIVTVLTSWHLFATATIFEQIMTFVCLGAAGYCIYLMVENNQGRKVLGDSVGSLVMIGTLIAVALAVCFARQIL